MGRPLPPRVIRSGPYKPTVPRTGDDSSGAFRKSNLITRGREGRFYEETFSGLGNLSETLNMVAITGTLTLTADSTTVAGVGTLFLSELRLGQKLCAISSDGLTSWPLVPKRIISNTSMEVWKAPDTSATLVIGWRMPRLRNSNGNRLSVLWGETNFLDKGNYLGAGDGVVRLNGSPFSASWTLQRSPSINLYAPTTETFTNFILGMSTPTVGFSAAAVGGGTKNMQAGSYSGVFTPARSATGGYNNPSPRIDVTIATGDQVQWTIAAADTANGQDGWWLWVTTFQESIGSDLNYLNGPWFLWPAGSGPGGMIVAADITGGLGGGTFTTEWLDAEIEVNEIVSFDNDAPTDAEGVIGLNNAPVWFSCQGQGDATNPTQTSPGPFIVPVKPTNIEAAPLSLAFSSSPPETILWALSALGRIYLLTGRHLQIAQGTPDQTVPILIRPFWDDGFAGPDQLVFVNGMLYGWTMGGPSRSVGDGDEIEAERSWAGDVYEITQTWPAGHVLVGYDPYNIAIVFFYSGFRRNSAGFWTTRWLMYGLPQGFWIGDGEFTSPIEDQLVSGVATINDRLEILIGGLS